MAGYKYDIQVTHDIKHNGFIEGTIGDYSWFAIVEDHEVPYAINQKSLRKGKGKVTRLCIYSDESGVDGNPFLPSMSIKRMIYANFHHEWSTFNLTFREMVHDLVTYLSRRFSMRMIE